MKLHGVEVWVVDEGCCNICSKEAVLAGRHGLRICDDHIGDIRELSNECDAEYAAREQDDAPGWQGVGSTTYRNRTDPIARMRRCGYIDRG